MYMQPMQKTDLALDALVMDPEGMLARLERACEESCSVLGTDVAIAVNSFKLALTASAATYCASVATAVKSISAIREGLKNVSAGMDALTSLCGCALFSNDAIASRAALTEASRGLRLLLALQDGRHPGQ